VSSSTPNVSFCRSWLVSRRISLATRRSGCVPSSRRDVDVVLVEEDPRLGLLGRRLEFVRLLLHEVGDRRVVL
jgi:hypothetical protein